MATAPRKGLNPARKIGSGADNGGMTEYNIASGYNTALGTGDLVKLHTDGTIIRGTNSADNLGMFGGCFYVDSLGKPQYQKYWPASQTSTVQPTALVMDNPDSTFHIVADGTVAQVLPGKIYAMNLETPDSATGRSQMTVKVLATSTGSTDLSANVDIPGTTAWNTNDTFTVCSSAGESATTITITASMTITQLLAALNAVTNISASLTSAGYVKISATNGYSLILADGTGTPLADDATLIGAAGTTAPTVSAGSSAVQVVKVVDTDNYVLECRLSNHLYRDDA